jgi:WhiB family redox-sensing transcriptional regulator
LVGDEVTAQDGGDGVTASERYVAIRTPTFETTWKALGRCRGEDPEMFFPVDGSGFVVARELCRRCRVRQACLEYALDQHIEHGVWGGVSERERQRINRLRRLEQVRLTEDLGNPWRPIAT